MPRQPRHAPLAPVVGTKNNIPKRLPLARRVLLDCMHRPKKMLAKVVKLVKFKNWPKQPNTVATFVLLEKDLLQNPLLVLIVHTESTKTKIIQRLQNVRRVPRGNLQQRKKMLVKVAPKASFKT